MDRFRDVLIAGGVQTITRERRGADIRAACGQLGASEGSRPPGDIAQGDSGEKGVERRARSAYSQ